LLQEKVELQNEMANLLKDEIAEKVRLNEIKEKSSRTGHIDVADEYLSYIREEVKAETTGSETVSVRQLFADRSLRKQLIVGVTVQLMMQFSGIDAVFYYSTTVFRQAQVADPELAVPLLARLVRRRSAFLPMNVGEEPLPHELATRNRSRVRRI